RRSGGSRAMAATRSCRHAVGDCQHPRRATTANGVPSPIRCPPASIRRPMSRSTSTSIGVSADIAAATDHAHMQSHSRRRETSMLARPFMLLVLGTIGALSTLTPAAAGSCCACDPICAQPAPVVVVPQPVYVRPVYVKPIYIVNQGPVYGGPGIVTRPLKKHFN